MYSTIGVVGFNVSMEEEMQKTDLEEKGKRMILHPRDTADSSMWVPMEHFTAAVTLKG